MKKIMIILSIICLIAFMLIWVSCSKQDAKYPEGKDTVESFGYGTYQLMRNPDRSISFVNLDISTDIEHRVNKYKILDNKLYTCGMTGYTIFETKTYQIKQFLTFDGYTESEIKQYKQYDEPDIIKLPGYKRLEKFEDFTDDERRIFGEMK